MSREPESRQHWEWAGRRPEPTPPPARDPLRKPQPPDRRRRKPIATKPKRDPYKTTWKELTPEEMASFRLYPKENG